MTELEKPDQASTQHAPQAQESSQSQDDGSPKFGRLLLVLLFAVALIVAITFATEAYHSANSAL